MIDTVRVAAAAPTPPPPADPDVCPCQPVKPTGPPFFRPRALSPPGFARGGPGARAGGARPPACAGPLSARRREAAPRSPRGLARPRPRCERDRRASDAAGWSRAVLRVAHALRRLLRGHGAPARGARARCGRRPRGGALAAIAAVAGRPAPRPALPPGPLSRPVRAGRARRRRRRGAHDVQFVDSLITRVIELEGPKFHDLYMGYEQYLADDARKARLGLAKS